MLLAQMVVEYAADVTGLVAGVTAASDAVATVGAAAAESSGYLATLGDQAFTTGVGFDGMAESLATVDASLVSVGASASEAVAGIGGVEAEMSAVAVSSDAAVVGIGGVEAELTGVAAFSDAAAASLGGLAVSADAVATAVDVASASLAAIGVGAAVVGVATSKMAGDFESEMTTLQTGAGEFASNMDLVSSSILNMAPQVGETTKQLADGMFMIESAGFHGAAGLDILKDAAEGAKVGNSDLQTTAQAVTGAMINYKDTNLTAAQATNDLIATVGAGQVKLQDLALAMATVEPIASKSGVSLADVSAAMATMTAKTIPAADAATYLRQTIMAIENPTSKAQDEMKSLGLNSADVAEKMKTSLPDALQMITDAAGKKFPVGSAGYIAAIANMVGGTKSMQGIMNLTGSDMATFKQNVEDISGKVKTGGDSISGWAKVQGDFNQKMDQAKGNLEKVGIEIGQKFLPVGKQLMDFLASPAFATFATNVGVGMVNAIQWLVNVIITLVSWGTQLTNFFEHNQVAMDFLIGALTAAAILIGGPLVLAFIGWGAAALLAGISTMIAMAPIILIGIVIAAVVAGIILAIQNWGAISKWLLDVWNTCVHAIVGFFTWLFDVLVGHSIIPDMINGIVNWFEQLPGRVGAAIQSMWTAAVNLFNGFLAQALTFGSNIVKGIADGITAGLHWISGAITNVTQFISDHLPHSPAKIGPLMGLQDQGMEISNQISKGMVNGTPLINSAIGNMLKPVAVNIKSSGSIATSGVSSASSPNQQTITIVDQTTHIVTLDGKKVGESTARYIQRDLRGHGLKK